jgi:hypothetical protein
MVWAVKGTGTSMQILESCICWRSHLAARAGGSAASTSARPPTFDHGLHSAATKTTFSFCGAPGRPWLMADTVKRLRTARRECRVAAQEIAAGESGRRNSSASRRCAGARYLLRTVQCVSCLAVWRRDAMQCRV